MASPLIPPLHWREGMFLRPHHFQQLQRQISQHAWFLLDAQFPHRWGVLRLAHDERLLAAGTFRLTSLAAVLRDGLIITDELLARPLERDLKGLQEKLRSGFQPIYLAVPLAGRADTADPTSKVSPEEALPRRFVPAPREAPDSNTGENPQVVESLAVNARLLVEGEERAGFECLRIAEAAYREDSFQLNPEHCPPLMTALPGTFVHELSKGVLAELQEGARYVLGLYSHQSAGGRESISLETRLKLHGLLGSVPLLEGLLSSGAARPFDLYLALCRVLGDLVGLQPDADLLPDAVARYDHEDLAGTFRALGGRIEECLRPVLRRKFPDFPFRAAEKGDFHLDEFRSDWLAPGRQLFVAAFNVRTPEETRRWMENCLIGPPGSLADFKKKLILGLERKLVEDPPPEIGFKRDWTIYRLELDPRLHAAVIDGIKKEGKLAVRGGWQGDQGSVAPQKMTLIVKSEDGAPAAPARAER